MSGLVPGAKVAVIGDRAVGVRGGGEIEQIVQAGELLLDHLGDRILQRRGVGAGIGGADHHRGRRDGGILLDRQGEGGDRRPPA